MANQQKREQINIKQKNIVCREEHSYLFGLIKWSVIVKKDMIGNDLQIWSNGTEINDIYLNGVKIK